MNKKKYLSTKETLDEASTGLADCDGWTETTQVVFPLLSSRMRTES